MPTTPSAEVHVKCPKCGWKFLLFQGWSKKCSFCNTLVTKENQEKEES